MGRKMITKTDIEKMLSPLPERTRKQYLDRVLTMIETEKEDKAVFLYIMRMFFNDFVKPIDMMNAVSKFVSSREELGIKSISLDSPETPLANEEELRTYTKIREDFFRMLDELGLKDEFKDFSEVNLDFSKGE